MIDFISHDNLPHRTSGAPVSYIYMRKRRRRLFDAEENFYFRTRKNGIAVSVPSVKASGACPFSITCHWLVLRCLCEIS